MSEGGSERGRGGGREGGRDYPSRGIISSVVYVP